MATIILSDGMKYTIPNSDLAFFEVIAEKMGWRATKIGNAANLRQTSTSSDAVDAQYTLSKLKGRFAPKYESREEIMDSYLSEKFGV